MRERGRGRRVLVLAVVAVLAGGCVHGAAGAGQAPCDLELLAREPAEPYEVLGSVQTLLTAPGEHPEEALRAPACALGADAVIVTRRFVTNDYGHLLVGGIAVRRAPAAAAARSPPASPPPPPGTVDL